jgi:hypothetical protein
MLTLSSELHDVMSRATRHADPSQGLVSAETAASAARVRQPMGSVDRSTRGRELAALAQLMQSGPRATAQRHEMDRIFGRAVQRQPAAEDEEPTVQHVAQCAGLEDEEPLQARVASGANATASPAPANRSGLPAGLKSGIEALSGLAMDGVAVHYNSSQPAQLNAHAFAQGKDIHLAPGQEQHLPHEAWHVVQQAQGRVRPTMQLHTGVPVNDDVGLEREADVMGNRALQLAGQMHGPHEPAVGMSQLDMTTGSIQRQIDLVEANGKKNIKRKNITAEYLMELFKKYNVLVHCSLEEAKKFISDGQDMVIDLTETEFVENEETGDLEEMDQVAAIRHKLSNLNSVIVNFCTPLEKKETKEEKIEETDELAELKQKFESKRKEINNRLQSENAEKDTKTSANDKHASLAQKIIGQSMVDAAEYMLANEKNLSKEGREWLKAQKKHGITKRDFTGEVHHH